MRIIWSAPVRADLEAIYNFIARENPYAAALATYSGSHRSIARLPHIGRIGRVENSRELVVGRTPYVVAYRIEEDRVAIIRIIHGRREWPLQF